MYRRHAPTSPSPAGRRPARRAVAALLLSVAIPASPAKAWGQTGATNATDRPQLQADTLHAFVAERHGRGRPVILIPGLASSGRVWDGTVRRYAGSHELHVLTLAGFAGVPPIEAPRFLDAQRDAIIQYIRDRRLERPVLVGHSLGAFLAFSVASTAPDLVGPVVAVDGVPFLTTLGDSTLTPDQVRPRAEMVRAAYAGLTPDQMEMQGRAAAVGMVTDPSHVSMVARWSRDSDPTTVGKAVVEMMTTDLRDSVAAIRTPVLLVAATGFARTPEQRAGAVATYQRQIRRVPDGRVVAAERARHFVMLDDPGFLYGLLDGVLAAPPARAVTKEVRP